MNTDLTLALRYLQGRKLRTTLTTLAIVFGVLVIFGMNSVLPVFIQAFKANTLAAQNQVDATIVSQIDEAFPQSVAAKVAAVDGVQAVSPSLERAISLPVNYYDNDPGVPDRINSIILVGIQPQAVRAISALNVDSGRFVQDGDTNSAVITQSLADAAGLQLGDTLRVPTATGQASLTVVGLLPQRLLPGSEEVYVTLPEAQSLFAMPGQINVIRANFDTVDAAARRRIENNITTTLGGSFAIRVLQQGAEILSNMQIAVAIINLLGGLALLMGGFIIFNTFRTVVAERRRDIGLLRSIGADRSAIVRIFLIEGLVQGLIGTAIGVLLGYLFARLLLWAIAPILLRFINLQVTPVTFQPLLVAVSVLAGVGVTLLAGLLPARAASRISPLEAMRPAIGGFTLKRLTGKAFWTGLALIVLATLALFSKNLSLLGLGSLLFVAGLLLISPSLVNPIARLFGSLAAVIFARDGSAGLAESNLSRQPGRAAITASTTMISLAILVMAASMVSSVQLTFSNMLRKSLSSDYLLVPPSVSVWGMDAGAAPALAQELRAIRGVEVVSTTRFANTQISDVPVGVLGIDPYAYQQTSGLEFSQGDQATAFQSLENGRGVILNGLLAGKTGLKVGDQTALLTTQGESTYTVVGIASDFLNAKTNTAYVSQASIAADFGQKEDVFFQINLTPGADHAAVEQAIQAALVPYPQFKLISGPDYLAQNLQLIDTMFAGMVALVLFLSIPSLMAMVNTLAIGVIERRREIGMLRAIGATRKQVGSVILAEALILSAIGTAFGILAGLYLGYSATGVFSAAGFPIDYVFPAAGLLLAVAAGLVFGALAAIIPARQAAGMQIVAALRYE